VDASVVAAVEVDCVFMRPQARLFGIGMVVAADELQARFVGKGIVDLRFDNGLQLVDSLRRRRRLWLWRDDEMLFFRPRRRLACLAPGELLLFRRLKRSDQSTPRLQAIEPRIDAGDDD
jgi:hypothetical protein